MGMPSAVASRRWNGKCDGHFYIFFFILPCLTVTPSVPAQLCIHCYTNVTIVIIIAISSSNTEVMKCICAEFCCLSVEW